jgi:polar amino acid transport system substrate-binding protein
LKQLTFVLIALFAFAAFGLSHTDVSDAGVPAQGAQKLRVGLVVGAPFVIQSGDHYTGYSIDYWEKVAGALGVAYEYVPLTTTVEVAVNNHFVDVAIGDIRMTAEGEHNIDFTHAYFDSGLRILTRPPHDQPFLSAFGPLVAPLVGQVFVFALIFGIIMAHVIFFVEHRGGNPQFQQGYLRDIWEAFWYLLVIIATGEYGDKEARTPIRRLVTVAFWLLGILFIAQFTAAVTSTETVQELAGEINGLDDLPGKRVVALENSIAADFLRGHQIPFTTVSQNEDAYPLLEQNQADAFVALAPVLEYYAANGGHGKVAVVGPEYSIIPIGMALPLGSPLRKPIDETILKFNHDGTRTDIVRRWFGSNAQ